MGEVLVNFQNCYDGLEQDNKDQSDQRCSFCLEPPSWLSIILLTHDPDCISRQSYSM